MLLINAGGDTTRNLVANGMLTLLDNRDQLELLRDNPALLTDRRRGDAALRAAGVDVPAHGHA